MIMYAMRFVMLIALVYGRDKPGNPFYWIP